MSLFRIIPALLALACPLTFAAEQTATDAIVAHAARQAELDEQK